MKLLTFKDILRMITVIQKAKALSPIILPTHSHSFLSSAKPLATNGTYAFLLALSLPTASL